LIDWTSPKLFGSIYSPSLCMKARACSTMLVSQVRKRRCMYRHISAWLCDVCGTIDS
jgi:hypothetical protein